LSAAADPRSHRRHEDWRFLSGQGRYVDDIAADTALHAVLVRSPHAHAAILGIDTTAAAAASGVRGVFTAVDLLADGINPLPCAMSTQVVTGLVVPPRHALAPAHVRHVGEAVALVVADSLLAALDAAELVGVDYDALPSVTELGEALQQGAVQLWPQAPGNLAFHFRRGDPAAVQAAFTTAAHSVSISLVNNRVVAASLETRAALAHHDASTGRLHLTISGQDVHGLRRDLATCFGLPPESIQVVCPDVGGGFGMKNVLHPEHVALLWAARRLGRPIRWSPERMEDFATGAHGRDNLTRARLALDAEGRFLALDVATTGNLGAYVSSLGPGAHTTAPSTAMGGLYAIPAIAMDVRGAFTNTVPVDAYRGAGKPEANYIIERLIDVAARQLGLDRIALRRQNLIDTFPYRSALGISIDTGRFHDNLEMALRAADHAGFPARRAEAAARGRLLGQGIGCFLETSRGQPTEDAAIRFLGDGMVELLLGTQSNGQGHETSFVQIAAATLGLPAEAFRLVQADSDRIGKGGGHGGARSLPMGGTALVMALDAVKHRAGAEAARLLQTEPARLNFERGVFHAQDGASMSLVALLQALPMGALDAAAHNPNDQFVFPNGCHVAEVEVDPETGTVALLRYLAVDDYGVLVNPLLTEGQVQGGLAQGIGQALMECVRYDPESGQLLTASFSDYTIPRAIDLPALDIRFNEHATRRNPLGAKGAGQAGAIGAPQTVINAVTDALGIAHLDMPVTPERVWQACRSLRVPAGTAAQLSPGVQDEGRDAAIL
jgi:carbon-monoxide dehydrogenase large subunit